MNADVEVLLDEFDAELNDAAGVHHWALHGVMLAWQEMQQFEGSTASIGYASDGPAYQKWDYPTIVANLSGSIQIALGNQWLVAVNTLWEARFREELAKAAGKTDSKSVVSPLFADIALIRNDIVHHRGIATHKNSGRVTTLHWVDIGEIIVIGDDRVEQLTTEARGSISFL